VVTSETITWRCEVCGLPIADDEGYVCVSYSDLRQRKDAARAWDARLAATDPKPKPGERVGYLVCAAEYVDHPGLVHWRVLHEKCDPASETIDDYWIRVHRLRTHAQVVRVTADVLGKKWVGETDWSSVLRSTVTRVASPATTRRTD
jgi:hypothetical protein